MLLGPLDEVGHNQEVAGILHALDDRELEVEALLDSLLSGAMPVSACKAKCHPTVPPARLWPCARAPCASSLSANRSLGCRW
jgi:hypothetical protein